MNIQQDLLRMKEELEADKSKKNRIEGEIDSLLAQLAKEGYPTIEEAEKACDTISAEIAKKETELNTAVQKLREAYNWKTV